MSRVTLIAHDQVRERMAAPSIRAVEMARELAVHGHTVTLAIPNQPELDLGPVRQIRDDVAELAGVMAGSDVVITGGGPYPQTPLNTPPAHVPHVVDMSFPLLLEALAMHRVDPGSWPQSRLDMFTSRMTKRVLDADVILCASREQRQLYLGWLAALGRLTAHLVEHDPAIDNLVRVAPFGCPAEPPVNTGSGPRHCIPGIGEGDYLLIWSGNVTDWYDPETVVRSVLRAAHRVPNVRLVFVGANTQDERLGRTPTGVRVRELAGRLDPQGKHVFFWDDWVRYEERADWLLDADAAVIATPRTLEADLAVRARFLDYVWCALPLITTAGGTFADEVARSGSGYVVEPGEVDGMADAIITMADDEVRVGMRARLQAIRPTYEWRRTLAPLIDFCARPAFAPDRGFRRWHLPVGRRAGGTPRINSVIRRAARRIRTRSPV